MKKQRYKLDKKKGIRSILYGMFAIMITVCLVVFLNIVLILIGLTEYFRKTPDNVTVTKLEVTDQGYELHEDAGAKLDKNNAWAMLLDEDGEVIWEYNKPTELADSYSRADITRMSKWYLQGYPVYLRIWDDKIIVTGYQKNTLWKYNIDFSLSWIDFMKQVWIYFFFINFIWIVGLAFLFTKKWEKKREHARIEWIAGISHDIRTPLSMVMGYADVLEHSNNLSDEERQQAAVIKHQSIVMKELIDDLNLTSRLEYSMQALRKEEVRPATVLREVVTSFLNDTREEQLLIALDIGETAENMIVKADRQLLIRAFRNLIHNSMQHGGQADAAEIRIYMRKDRNKCLFRFEDSGIGYSEEVLRQLSNKRRKAAAQNIRGLDIVQKIILAHGGQISFGNRQDGGCFCEMRMRCVRRTPKQPVSL